MEKENEIALATRHKNEYFNIFMVPRKGNTVLFLSSVIHCCVLVSASRNGSCIGGVKLLQAIVLKHIYVWVFTGSRRREKSAGERASWNLNFVTNSHRHHLFSICFVTIKFCRWEKFFANEKFQFERGSLRRSQLFLEAFPRLNFSD